MGNLAHERMALPDRIVLAHELPFRIGGLSVQPVTRQVERDGAKETLEPRVMQVLVALAQGDGAILTRDELIERCWGGTIVTEDAINRVISRLRHIAADVGKGAFQIETIRGVGYRLTGATAEVDPVFVPIPAARPPLPQTGFSRRSLVGGTVAAAAVAGLAGAWLLPGTRRKPLPLAQQYYERGIATRGQASLQLAEQGLAHFREATRIDPQFAAAWGALAWSYRGLLEFGPRADSARLHALSRSAAARALELDSGNSDAQAALLLLKPFYGNWAEIERGLRRLSLEHPANSIIEYNLAYVLAEVGRDRESLPYIQAVARRERFWPLTQYRYILTLYAVGRAEEAENLIDEAMKRFPRRKDFWTARMHQLINSGRLPEAVAFAQSIADRPAVGIEPAIDFEVMIAHALADGSPAARRTAVDQLVDTARASLQYLPVAAVSACLLGHKDVTFEMLDGYFLGRGPWAAGHPERPWTNFLFVASTAPLRRDARFARLLRESGLEGYWRTTRTIPDYRRLA